MSQRPSRQETSSPFLVISLLVACCGIGIADGAAAQRLLSNTARTNINREINVNRNVNVNVYAPYDRRYNHPVATAAAVTAGVAITAAAIGSIVRTLPPSCTTVITRGLTYQQCGSVWYQPQYAGTQVTYVVVNPPQ